MASGVTNGSTNDWPCPNSQCINSHKLVFGNKSSCPKCGSTPDTPVFGSPEVVVGPNDGKTQGGMMPGDWQCPNMFCINHTRMVFAKFTACPKCCAAKEAGRPGDWVCPNATCLNNKNAVFGSKTACPRCGTLRPGSSGGLPSVNTSYGGKSFGKGNLAITFGSSWFGQVNPAGLAGNPGDWQCPNEACLNNKKGVFAKNDTCPKCLSPKPTSPGNVPGQDWQCPNTSCMNHEKGVFGKHDFCPKCFTPKPDFPSPVEGADWQCPNVECMNNKRMVFGKHSACPACGAVKPTANVLSAIRGAGGRSRSPYRSG
jgi:hypothetical protein|eukprot:TRINITY_DN63288_c0_g1_i1.p1 TRINITY_DN63288_c0_g1~~TRINITY_DN63288_c0_g1_i1.p1  ORF type:complete len:359 (+),score=27.56 TRINITY_DN63288_c0_g1_i1:140-1078(+)